MFRLITVSLPSSRLAALLAPIHTTGIVPCRVQSYVKTLDYVCEGKDKYRNREHFYAFEQEHMHYPERLCTDFRVKETSAT